MASFNKVILMGNLTRDPEMRYTQGGMAVCNFDIAVNDGYGDKKETLFMRIATFNKQAENCSQFLAKGRPVLIDGRLKANVWEKEDGTKQTRVEVLASNVTFLRTGDTPGEQAGNSQNATVDISSIDDDVTDDDIPF